MINENHYYENIFQLHLSVSVCSGYNELNGNHARHILKAKQGSYLIAKNNAILNMSENVVYMVAKQIRTFADGAKPICPLQFWNSRSFYNNLDALNIKVLMLNNVHMMSKHLQGEDLLFKNCAWLAGFAFYKISAKKVYQRILVIQNIVINKTTERKIPLSVCPCSTSNNMSCYSPDLGSLFPGQTLQINLVVRKQNKIPANHSTTLVAANTPDDDCSITDSYQLFQTHLNSGCNNYTYTIWPSHRHITECLLFIGLIETPEMFYVQIKHCPKGFTLQEHKRSCNCDPVLSNIITSCNLDDQTVFRPAKSWISADTVNDSHTYRVTQPCPFDYCLLHSSHLDLATPDVQCQFRRSGLLCGHCQQGLSTVFGSSQCKHCSNIPMLIILPIAIAGIALVIMLFLFDITVTNGTINSFVFYVNTISINYSTFCHEKYSVYCTLLHLLNLDLGIETCFYNGMDDYAKMWLQLIFPSYLLTIAFALIIGSRYSNTIQKLTSRRALQVLATLFLLSYTKLLLTVCKTLFFFSVITHLPNKHTTLVWSIDASVPVFGIKFSIIFVVCLIIFLILLLFNILLLFPWTLLRFKYINTFKPLFDAYFGPYKDKYSFWTGFQLLVRAIFIGVSSLDKSVGMFSEVIVLGILLCIQGIVHPFRSRLKNLQESLILLDLLIVYIVGSLIKHSLNLLLIKLLISILLAYIIIYITCHCITLMCGNMVKQRYKKLFKWFKKTNNRRSSVSVEMISYHCDLPEIKVNYEEFQEPLIALSK